MMETTYQQVRNPNGSVNPEIIIKLPEQLYIPANSDNTDYQAYLEWVAQGNTPLPPEA